MKNLPSVTQVLGILRKPGLEYWFKNNTAEFCDFESKKGKEIGIIIHSIIQANIDKIEIKFNTQYAQEVLFCLKGLEKFKRENQDLKLKRSEMEIISRKHGFRGHLDCLGEENNELLIIDWKTSKCDVGVISNKGFSKEKDVPVIYPEYEYQVSAYVAAYNEQNNVDIQRAKIVCFAKDKPVYANLTLHKIVMDRMFNEVFLPLLSIYKYQEERNERRERNDHNDGKNVIRSHQKKNGISVGESSEIPIGF